MIKQLEGHITEHQLELITEMIREQYQRYLRLTGNQERTIEDIASEILDEVKKIL